MGITSAAQKDCLLLANMSAKSAIDTSSLFFHLATPQTTEKPSDIDMNHSVWLYFLYKKRYTIKKTSDMVRFIHKLHVIFNEHWCLMCRCVYEEGKHKSITVTLKSYILMYIWWFCGYLDNVYMSKLILWRN